MKLGLIIPNHPNEKRVALLPEHINNFENEIYIEKGFGKGLDIDDIEYIEKGCTVLSKEELFKTCDGVFSLKTIKEEDYHLVRENQIILGWTHPHGSGKSFMINEAIPKNLVVVDFDNIHPAIFYKNQEIPLDYIPKNFIYSNSFIAGYASALHAVMCHGLIPDSSTKVAILGSGNTSQGAYKAMSKFNVDIRLFYRNTLNEFFENINSFDIIINGIEISPDSKPLISINDISNFKKNSLIIDAAACATRTIEFSIHTSYDKPIIYNNGIYFYSINNSPSIFYRTSSKFISESFSKHFYSKDLSTYLDIIKKQKK